MIREEKRDLKSPDSKAKELREKLRLTMQEHRHDLQERCNNAKSLKSKLYNEAQRNISLVQAVSNLN